MLVCYELCYELYRRLRACEHGALAHQYETVCSVNIYIIIIIVIIIIIISSVRLVCNRMLSTFE